MSKSTQTLYRIYKATVQRVPLEIKSLNSAAAFLILLDTEKQVILWIGCDCESTDSELAKELAKGVISKDYHERDNEIPLIMEEAEPPQLLNAMLEIFWSNSNTYLSKSVAHQRKEKISNNSVSVGIIKKMSAFSTEYDFQETAFAHPDSTGMVPRVAFAPLEKNTTAYVNTGDQWDVWFARGVLATEQGDVLKVLESAIASNIAPGTVAFQKEILAQYIQVIYQGDERFLFRRPLKIFTDFEPPGKTLPRPDTVKLSSNAIAIASKAQEEERPGKEPNSVKEDKRSVLIGGNKADLIPSLLPPKLKSIEDDKPTKPNVSRSGRATSPRKEPSVRFKTAVDKPSVAKVSGLDLSNLLGRGSSSELQKNTPIPVDDVTYDNFADPKLLEKATSKANTLTTESSPTHQSLNVVTKDMVSLVESENIGLIARNELLQEAAKNPTSLVGWQV